MIIKSHREGYDMRSETKTKTKKVYEFAETIKGVRTYETRRD